MSVVIGTPAGRPSSVATSAGPWDSPASASATCSTVLLSARAPVMPCVRASSPRTATACPGARAPVRHLRILPRPGRPARPPVHLADGCADAGRRRGPPAGTLAGGGTLTVREGALSARRMAASGAGARPVICSTRSTARWSSRSSPLTTAPPYAD